MLNVRRSWRVSVSCAAIGFGVMLVVLTLTGVDTTLLREWLGVLVLPVVLAIGCYILFEQIKIRDRQAREDRRGQSLLKSYLDRITTLMTEKGLMEANFEDPVAQVARALTITALRELDTPRQNALIQFLLDAHLLQPSIGCDRGPALLKQAQWSNANLPRIILTEVDLSHADLYGAHLGNANLRGSNLRRADLSGADLRAADLSGADLRGANLFGANLSGANLQRANLNLANLEAVDLSEANLSQANLNAAKLSGTNLHKSNLHGANLTSSKLMHSNLSGANLSGATLHWSNLERADLEGAYLEGTIVESANLCGANLNLTEYFQADFSRARYNAKTIHPETFNPEARGMINMDKSPGIFTYQ